MVVLTTHPIQYYAPLYRCLTERGVIDIKVIYLTDAGAVAHDDVGFSRKVEWDIPLLEGYEYCVLQAGTPITSRGFWSRHDGKLLSELIRAQPDWLLIYGYTSRMNWVAVDWATRNDVRVVYSSDSNIRDPQRRHVLPLKKLLLRYFFRQIDAFFSPSEANADYLLRFGVEPGKVQRIPFAIDVNRFKCSAAALDGSQRRYDFVWAGKFLDFKRPADFLQALNIWARRNNHKIKACIVGDGPCREALAVQAANLPSNCIVDFLGFVNQSGMPAVLQAADTLVFTSEREPYGLIATEAAAAGLALVVAMNIGCVGKTVLARPGVNALIYSVGDVHSLARSMGRLLDDPQLRLKMQQGSLSIAGGHDFPNAAEVMERVVTSDNN